jgi:uncharacterized membrane protein
MKLFAGNKNQFITRREHVHAQFALAAAILFQVGVLLVNQNLAFGPQYLIIATEIGMAVLLGSTINAHSRHSKDLQKATAGILLGFISFANITSLGIVLNSLIFGHTEITGAELLISAIAIFLTNIIVYALWYWEIDSPGFTSSRWSNSDKDFQFTQQDMQGEFPEWRPEFLDYLYLSVTNALNFAPADTRPLTRPAKTLMASQALVSVFTLALVIARSVSILG